MWCMPNMALNRSHLDCTGLNVDFTLAGSGEVVVWKQHKTVMKTSKVSGKLFVSAPKILKTVWNWYPSMTIVKANVLKMADIITTVEYFIVVY